MEVNSVSLVYILTHLGKRILDFFRHWYIDGFLISAHWTYNILERLDKYFALRITAKNWFQPLYQDYSVVGYLWGFIFRTLRVFVGLVIYLLITFAAAVLFLIWASVPVFVIYRIINSL